MNMNIARGKAEKDPKHDREGNPGEKHSFGIEGP
jgi:hypothetical protein